MNQTEINKINETIVKAMGLFIIEKPMGIPPLNAISVRAPDRWFDPYNSMNDVFKAVNEVADGKYYSIEIQYHPFHEENKKFGVFLKIERFFKSGGSRVIQTLEFAETPEAAATLALVEYIKEEK